MLTAAKLLALPEDELGVELAKVLTPGPWKHDEYGTDTGTELRRRCRKCQRVLSIMKPSDDDWADTDYNKKPCPIPDAIDIKDWGLAMKWARKCERLKFSDALESVFCKTHECQSIGRMWWMQFYAQPKHYLIAAALSAGKDEE